MTFLFTAMRKRVNTQDPHEKHIVVKPVVIITKSRDDLQNPYLKGIPYLLKLSQKFIIKIPFLFTKLK